LEAAARIPSEKLKPNIPQDWVKKINGMMK
jgi:hypothetical protein